MLNRKLQKEIKYCFDNRRNALHFYYCLMHLFDIHKLYKGVDLALEEVQDLVPLKSLKSELTKDKEFRKRDNDTGRSHRAARFIEKKFGYQFKKIIRKSVILKYKCIHCQIHIVMEASFKKDLIEQLKYSYPNCTHYTVKELNEDIKYIEKPYWIWVK